MDERVRFIALVNESNESFSALCAQFKISRKTGYKWVAHLPDETKTVYLAKARVLALIEKLNRLAKLAFKGRAEIIGHFNKDLILRARRARKPSETEPKPSAEPTEA